jgi:hypothetical protein
MNTKMEVLFSFSQFKIGKKEKMILLIIFIDF